mmetsp:Transcript_7044/g.14144  ORF Transcript_7044/g.14144 Transcript_7044/m.14144 type:complete len:398 (+) Transcript_7044:309-1502(+)
MSMGVCQGTVSVSCFEPLPWMGCIYVREGGGVIWQGANRLPKSSKLMQINLSRFLGLVNLLAAEEVRRVRFNLVSYSLLGLLLLLFLKVLGKSLCHDQRKDKGHLGIKLDRGSFTADLTPRDGLVRAGTRVRAVELTCSVNKDGKVSTVAHQVSVTDVVLDNATSEDDHTGLVGTGSSLVNATDVTNNVKDEVIILVGAEVEHVANAAVSDRRAIDGNVVLVGPVVNRLRVVDLLTKAVDHLARGPGDTLLKLLLVHFVKDRGKPLLKLNIVVVGDKQVANAVETLLAECLALEIEGTEVGRGEALDKVFLDTAGGGYNHINHLVLHEETQNLADARRDKVGCVGEENGALGVGTLLRVGNGVSLAQRLVTETPAEHLVDLLHSKAKVGALESNPFV